MGELIRTGAGRIMAYNVSLEGEALGRRYPTRECAWCGSSMWCLETDLELILHFDCERVLAERDPEAVTRFVEAAADGAARRRPGRAAPASLVVDRAQSERHRSMRVVIKALDELDRTGESFRYAARKDGGPALEENLNFSLERVQKVYHWTLRNLDKADDVVVLAGADIPPPTSGR